MVIFITGFFVNENNLFPPTPSPSSPRSNTLMYAICFVSLYPPFQLCHFLKWQPVDFRCPTALWKTVIAGSFFMFQPPSHHFHIKPYCLFLVTAVKKNKTNHPSKNGARWLTVDPNTDLGEMSSSLCLPWVLIPVSSLIKLCPNIL